MKLKYILKKSRNILSWLNIFVIFRNAVIDLSEEEDNIEIKEDSPSSSSHNITNKTPSRLTKRKSSSSEKKQPAKRQRVKSGSRTKIKPDMKAVPVRTFHICCI